MRRVKTVGLVINTMYPLYRKLADKAQEGTDISSWKQKEDSDQLNYQD